MRAAIRREVASIRPFDELEKIHQADALAWIDSGVPLCRTAKPATPPKHLVSYFAVVDGHDILLVDHKSAQLWLPPGGHVEPGEHPRETVVRELFEELRRCDGMCSRSIGVKASKSMSRNSRRLSGSDIRMCRFIAAIHTWGDFWRN